MTEHKPTLADPLEPEQIEAWLREHPEFFENHPDLLAELSLPHESGSAISLVERQVRLLRDSVIGRAIADLREFFGAGEDRPAFRHGGIDQQHRRAHGDQCNSCFSAHR